MMIQSQSSTPVASPQGLAPWQAKRVEGLVAERLSSPIQVWELAQVARLSPARFSRGFKALFGASPRVWIGRQRIGQAQRMMLESQDSLGQIALDCGFSDQAHFTNVFRRTVGVTPGAWRRARRAAG